MAAVRGSHSWMRDDSAAVSEARDCLDDCPNLAYAVPENSRRLTTQR